jgi:hypothetical protein
VAGHDGVRYASVGGRVSPRNNPHRSNDVAIETTPVIGRYYTAKDGMGKMRQVTSDDLRAYAKEAGDIKVASRYLIAARELDRMKG